jgi:hypothetical protein
MLIHFRGAGAKSLPGDESIELIILIIELIMEEKEWGEEKKGPAVFPLLFFARGRKRSMRREKKHKDVIKKSPKISVSFKKFETLPYCRLLCHLPFMQVSSKNVQS